MARERPIVLEHEVKTQVSSSLEATYLQDEHLQTKISNTKKSKSRYYMSIAVCAT